MRASVLDPLLFEESEEQSALRASVRDFVDREVPREMARQYDEAEELPDDIFKKIAAMGWMGLCIDEEYGGSGGTAHDIAIVIEELSYRMAALAFAVVSPVFMCGHTIGLYGNKEQRAFHLGGISSGEHKWAIGLTEPSGGTDALSMRTRAAKTDDGWVVNGSKIFTTGAHIADYIMLAARTTPGTEGTPRGVSLFILPRSTPGVTVRPLPKLGFRAVKTNEVFLDDVVIPSENLVGQLDEGWYHVVHALNFERLCVPAILIGISRAALDDAVAYAKERTAFGKPIGQFQSLQHYMAEAAARIEQSRLLLRKLCDLYQAGREYHIEAAIAKLSASETAQLVTRHGMQIMGGYGFIKDFDMERYFRDHRMLTFGPVSDEMCKNIIGERLLGLPRSY